MVRVRFVAAALAACLLGAVPLRAQDAPLAEQAPVRDRVLEALVQREIDAGPAWFALTIGGKRSGSLNVRAERRVEDGRPYVRHTSVASITVTAAGAVNTLRVDEVTDVSLVPPYPLLRHENATTSTTKSTTTTTSREVLRVVRNDDGTYGATIRQGEQERTRALGRLDLGLADQLSVPRWLDTPRSVGATHRFRELDEDRLVVRTSTATVLRREAAPEQPAAKAVYHLRLVDDEEDETDIALTAEGRLLRLAKGDLYLVERTTEEDARRLESHGDLFFDHTVRRAGRRIGDGTRVTTLVLRTSDALGPALGSAPGQTVTRKDDGTTEILLHPGRGPRVAATEEDRLRALEATVDVPAREESVVALARRAVGSARTPEEKVRKLVVFVQEFIEDDLHAEPGSVLDVIRARRGDCSEHADLLTTLARAVGVPCRSVGGLMYMGRESDAFGGHAWNEVVLDGHWVPVDPTWGQFPIDATHIRFPIGDAADMRATTASRGATLTVVDVKR